MWGGTPGLVGGSLHCSFCSRIVVRCFRRQGFNRFLAASAIIILCGQCQEVNS